MPGLGFRDQIATHDNVALKTTAVRDVSLPPCSQLPCALPKSMNSRFHERGPGNQLPQRSLSESKYVLEIDVEQDSGQTPIPGLLGQIMKGNGQINTANSFNAMLRDLRRARSLSQLELAMMSGCSQRHLSFLECGHSRPSRNMIISLSEAMDVPLHQRNELLLAAGFAPYYSGFKLSDPELHPVREAMDHLLQTHHPYPAVAFDWRHDILAANEAAIKLQLFLFGAERAEGLPDCAKNVMRGLLHPDGYRSHIANWGHVSSVMMRRFRSEVLELGRSGDGHTLLEEFSSYLGDRSAVESSSTDERPNPMLTVDIRKDGLAFSLFSILSSLGAPFDVTLQEIRIESFYPVGTEAIDFFERFG